MAEESFDIVVVGGDEGGLAVDSRHRVLGAEDRPIPGLYAVGASGQGTCFRRVRGTTLRGLSSRGVARGDLRPSTSPSTDEQFMLGRCRRNCQPFLHLASR